MKKMIPVKFIGPILLFALPVFASNNHCASFSSGDCRNHLDSCFIDKNSRGYFCREPQGRCEVSWRQEFTGQQFNLSDSVVEKQRRDCELQPKCKFQPAGCLCHCDFLVKGELPCDCECGGGAPSRCVLVE